MLTRSCIHKFYDEGCIDGKSISLSPNDRYLACGSSSGIVNIYETESLINESSPAPVKYISNLTTSISSLTFNHSSEVLAIASDVNSNAFKLVSYCYYL